jgi:hypothetical protein
MGSINDDISAISYLAQNNPGALCEKCSIADFDVRIWLPQKLWPKEEAGYIF